MSEISDSNGTPRQPSNGNGKPRVNGDGGPMIWTVLDLISHRWHWLVIGGILGCAAFFELSWALLIKPRFVATVQMLRYDTPGTSESLKGNPLSAETFSALLVSPELLRRVGDKLEPPVPAERLVKQMKVDPQPESDLVKVMFVSGDPPSAVNLANLYAEHAVTFTKDLQAKQAVEIANNFLKKQVGELNQDINVLQEQFRGTPMAGAVTNKLTQVSNDVSALSQHLATTPRPSPFTLKLLEKLETSRAELAELTGKYTDIHPQVRDKRSQIEKLQSELTNTTSVLPPELAATMTVRSAWANDPNFEIIQAKLRSLEDARIQMVNRQREAELYAANPPGMVRVFAPATIKTTQSNHRRIKIGLVTVFGGFFGIGCALGLLLLTEAFDNRLKTVDDLRRVTRLPVLTTLGDLQRMEEEAQTQWAFRTWTLLQGRLSQSQNHGLVCGITSSTPGEGRSTWIKLLAEAASMTGFRVLTVATRPSPTYVETLPPHDLLAEGFDGQSEQIANGNGNGHAHGNGNGNGNGHGNMNAESDITTTTGALTSNVLASPAQVTDQLTDPNSQPIVHIPLPGWVWNLERRKQWGDALSEWRRIDNLVIFVELPPASVPEAVLLGSNLPNLLWLTESGIADAGDTRTQLETLRHARCNLVGAVLNREPSAHIKRRFPRWITAFALLASLASGAMAQTNTPADTLPIEAPADEVVLTPTASASRTNVSFSIVSPTQRAAWSKNLTLGPGDIVTLGLYGEPLMTRTEVMIGPDGRVTYLEARDIVATGLTVDELRTKFDEELGKYRRSARTMITPVSYRSKKYYLLGKVTQRGVYVLDRPITVIEALARGRGMEIGLVDNNTVDLADFSRSFIARGGKRIALDFEKLFNGDLSQNLQVEPDDFLYFPSGNVQQVYVLGEVGLPGPVTFRGQMSAVGAIAARGGFNEKSYKGKVLVVRGSINQPQTFIVDVLGVTKGNAMDFKLEPKDIVYVSHRPFYRAEDLLDMAVTAFVQSVIANWTGNDVAIP